MSLRALLLQFKDALVFSTWHIRSISSQKIKRSVNGVIGILQACLDSKTVKRVVYTSSSAAVWFNESGLDIMDETSWTDVNYIRRDLRGQVFSSYAITKVLAEKAAFEFAEKNGLEVVSVIPTWIHGPFICPFFPGSVRASMAMIFGLQDWYRSLQRTCFVHVEDVARAHVFLFESPNAKGRYICSAVELTFEQLSGFLSAKYSNDQYPIPSSESLNGIEGLSMPGVSSRKLLDMGFKYKFGIEEMFDGALESCKLKGFL